jgi:hypothetical protein
MSDPTRQTAGYATWAIALAGLALSLFGPRGVQDWAQPILIAALAISAAFLVTASRELSPALVRALAATTLIGGILAVGMVLVLGGYPRLLAGAGFLVAGVILWGHVARARG